jgi:hypothetical protein
MSIEQKLVCAVKNGAGFSVRKEENAAIKEPIEKLLEGGWRIVQIASLDSAAGEIAILLEHEGRGGGVMPL